MYAQKIEGKNWKDEKLDKAKIDKMSGKLLLPLCSESFELTQVCRPTDWPTLRAHASYPEARK